MVQVQLCEVPSESALAWTCYARRAVREAVADPEGVQLSRGILSMIGRFLDDWEARALKGPTLRLSVEMHTEELESLTHAFFLLSQYATAEADRRGYDISPPEGDEFYAALSDAVIATLEFSGESSATEFAGVLRDTWPRTERLSPGDPGEAKRDDPEGGGAVA